MELRQYLRMLRSHWMLIVGAIVVCAGAATLIDGARTPVYEARTQLFVSTSGAPADLSQTYQGGLFSQQRVRSYAQIVDSPSMADLVIRRLGLTEDTERLQRDIRASVPVDTVLIDISVRNRSPERARAIADVLGEEFPNFVNSLETPLDESPSPVKISVTSEAQTPTRSVSPQRTLDLALAALFGLFAGIVAAIARETLDTRVKGSAVATQIIDAPVLGNIAEARGTRRHPLVVVEDPLSAKAEAYRRLRTNVLALGVDRGFTSLVVSSATDSEGKTIVAVNLGVALAQAGYRVFLIDANLCRPMVSRMLGLNPKAGLSELLAGKAELANVTYQWRDGFPLSVIPSGQQPSNPSELLGSQRLADTLADLTRQADVVILDSPSILEAADTAVLAGATSGFLLLTRMSATRTDQLIAAGEALRAVGAEVVGLVLTGHPPDRKHRVGGLRRSRRRSLANFPVPVPAAKKTGPDGPGATRSSSGVRATRTSRGARPTKRKTEPRGESGVQPMG